MTTVRLHYDDESPKGRAFTRLRRERGGRTDGEVVDKLIEAALVEEFGDDWHEQFA